MFLWLDFDRLYRPESWSLSPMAAHTLPWWSFVFLWLSAAMSLFSSKISCWKFFCVCLEFHFVQTSRCGFLHDYCEKLEHPTISQIVVLKSHCLVNLTSDLFSLLCFHRLSHTLWLDVPFSVLNYTFEFYNAFTCFLWKSYCLLYPELVDFNKNGNLTLCWASTWGVNTNFS